MFPLFELSVLVFIAVAATPAQAHGWAWKAVLYEGEWQTGRQLELGSESLEGCINLSNKQLCSDSDTSSRDCVSVVANANSLRNIDGTCVRVYSTGDCNVENALMEIRPWVGCHYWNGWGIKGEVRSIGGCPSPDPDFNHTSKVEPFAFWHSSYINSTKWPKNYNDNENTNWVYSVPFDRQMVIYFESWDIEGSERCRYDKLTITELITDEILFIGCGEALPAPIVPKSNQVRINFISDQSENRKGFRLRFDTHFAIYYYTSNFPHNYPDDADETKEYSIGYGDKKYDISFEVFEIEGSSHCSYDKLTIYDGYKGDPVLFEGCGSELPDPVRSSGKRITIHFKSDGSKNHRGVLIKLMAV